MLRTVAFISPRKAATAMRPAGSPRSTTAARASVRRRPILVRAASSMAAMLGLNRPLSRHSANDRARRISLIVFSLSAALLTRSSRPFRAFLSFSSPELVASACRSSWTGSGGWAGARDSSRAISTTAAAPRPAGRVSRCRWGLRYRMDRTSLTGRAEGTAVRRRSTPPTTFHYSSRRTPTPCFAR